MANRFLPISCARKHLPEEPHESYPHVHDLAALLPPSNHLAHFLKFCSLKFSPPSFALDLSFNDLIGQLTAALYLRITLVTHISPLTFDGPSQLLTTSSLSRQPTILLQLHACLQVSS
ncbi:MAG TPA: hypothetical protein VGO47_02505 [Chlamydiales bacterium]|nr:hypothetical protein [Chlamydiales bacterium]